MIVPEFLRFYQGYTVESVLSGYAITFFSLVNSMYRIKADEMITNINNISVGNAEPKDRQSVIDELSKSSRGIHGIVEEVRTVRKNKK